MTLPDRFSLAGSALGEYVQRYERCADGPPRAEGRHRCIACKQNPPAFGLRAPEVGWYCEPCIVAHIQELQAKGVTLTDEDSMPPFKGVWTIDGKARHAMPGPGRRNADMRTCCGISVWYSHDYRRPDFKLGSGGNCRNCERVILAREPCELGHGAPGEYARPKEASEHESPASA